MLVGSNVGSHEMICIFPFYCCVLLSTHMLTNVKLGSPVLAKLFVVSPQSRRVSCSQLTCQPMSNWGRQFLQNFCGVATESQEATY